MRTLARSLGAHIQDIYGADEWRAPIAVECAQGNQHLLEDGAIESVDARGARRERANSATGCSSPCCAASRSR
ncbi:MAG: hypothetical protein U1F35_08990 [Steroidobacteraceae bacterium]